MFLRKVCLCCYSGHGVPAQSAVADVLRSMADVAGDVFGGWFGKLYCQILLHWALFVVAQMRPRPHLQSCGGGSIRVQLANTDVSLQVVGPQYGVRNALQHHSNHAIAMGLNMKIAQMQNQRFKRRTDLLNLYPEAYNMPFCQEESEQKKQCA